MYAQISPTPRELSVCCGISLLIHQEDIDAIRKLAKEQELEYIGIEGLDNEFNMAPSVWLDERNLFLGEETMNYIGIDIGSGVKKSAFSWRTGNRNSR